MVHTAVQKSNDAFSLVKYIDLNIKKNSTIILCENYYVIPIHSTWHFIGLYSLTRLRNTLLYRKEED